jgi:uncharacterized protein GlcG (DUF336 family)
MPLRYLIAALLLLPLANSPMAGEASPVISYNSLGIKMANMAAWAALDECRQRGYSVTVAIVDRGGNTQVLLRDQHAGPHTVKTATRKAWTANSFRQSTAELAAMLQEGRIPNQVQHNPGALLVGGGLVISAAGQTIGGIGVSGAPPGKSERDSIDGACALAGLEAIREELLFAE